jgi:glycosyltransferase involved in cell wall biosynthesis
MAKSLRRILITTSTLPASADDPVPAFVHDQVIALKKEHPELEIHVLAPHNAYTKTEAYVEHPDYIEHRFHYFWPHRLELLAGRGIAPALKAHKWLYLAIPFLFLFEMMATYRLAKRLKPSLLYVHWFTPQGITAAPVAKRLRIPLVFTTHASDVAILKKFPFTKKLVTAICRQAVSYTAVSEQTAERLRSFWPADQVTNLEAKLHIIPMGTDDVDTLNTSATLPADQSLPGKQVIYFIGRVVSRKGIFDLVEAFSMIHKANDNAVLVIAGDGQDKAALEQKVQELGLNDAVHFVGYVNGDTKAAWLNRADIVCIPSVNEGAHAEGMPVTYMEALAAGKIVVASDVSGAQEYTKSGVDGYIFPERNVQELAAALTTVLNLNPDEAAIMGKAAQTLSTNFSWPKVAAEHYTVLQDAVTNYDAAQN